MRTLFSSDRKKLESSSFVEKFTEKQIIFNQKFRELVLEGTPGKTREQHFNELLGVNCFDKKFVDSCLNRWRKQKLFKDVPKRKGRRKDLGNMTVEELEAEVAYQKEVIEQLKKARGLTDWDL